MSNGIYGSNQQDQLNALMLQQHLQSGMQTHPNPAYTTIGRPQGAGLSGLHVSPETLAFLKSQNPDLFPGGGAPIYHPQPSQAIGPGADENHRYMSAMPAQHPAHPMRKRHPHRYDQNHGGN